MHDYVDKKQSNEPWRPRSNHSLYLALPLALALTLRPPAFGLLQTQIWINMNMMFQIETLKDLVYLFPLN